MKQFIILTVFHLLFINIGITQKVPYNIEWSKCYGGTGDEIFNNTIITPDKGHISAGYNNDKNGDVTINHGNTDAWIVKTSETGKIQWQRSYGGSEYDDASDIKNTNDGGYIFAGSTGSYDGDVTGQHGSGDVWVVKINSEGIIQWEKCFGGSTAEGGKSIEVTKDGGYIIGGVTSSSDGDVSGYHGLMGQGNAPDIWIIKIDSVGNLLWEQCYGGEDYDNINELLTTNDGGYLILGVTSSIDGEVIGNHGGVDAWLLKIDSIGNIEWQKCYGGSDLDNLNSIYITKDNSYILAGTTSSNNGDVSGNHGGRGSDAWIVKIDSSGSIQWQKCFGGTKDDNANKAIQTNDGGYIFIGNTVSTDGDLDSIYIGNAWIVKIDSSGSIQWQKCFGGSGQNIVKSLELLFDGGYLFSGGVDTNDGDVVGYHYNSFSNKTYDGRIVKISDNTLITNTPTYIYWNNNDLNIFPNPTHGTVRLETINVIQIKIFDATGRIYISKNIDPYPTYSYNDLNIQYLASGMYVIQAVTNSGTILTKKLIVE